MTFLNKKITTRFIKILFDYTRLIVVGCILFVLAMPFGYAQNNYKKSAIDSTKNSSVKELRSGGYNLINPLLDCYEIKSSTNALYKQIELKLNEYIKNAMLTKKATNISVYFRDLKNGPWIGINEKENYSPASLLKVPYMMAALYQAETDPTFLTKKVTFTNPRDIYTQNIVDGFKLISGNQYTIEELINAMTIHSDNDAKNLIMDYLTDDSYYEIFNELGIDIRKYDSARTSVDFFSVKEYASFFRILYNATFLNKQMSEKALSILTNSNFKDGIRAGIKDPVIIANKFGERTFYNSDIKQLHDCGIIYKPDHPYILCVMTRGTDNPALKEIISDISKIIYTQLK